VRRTDLLELVRDILLRKPAQILTAPVIYLLPPNGYPDLLPNFTFVANDGPNYLPVILSRLELLAASTLHQYKNAVALLIS